MKTKGFKGKFFENLGQFEIEKNVDYEKKIYVKTIFLIFIIGVKSHPD